MSDLQVLFVAGPGRSGSTLLTDALGQLEGWVNAGELAYFWRNRRPGAARRCGCGEPMPRCAFWSSVAEAAAAAGELSDAAFELAYGSRASRRWLQLPRLERRADPAYVEWQGAYLALCKAVLEVSGARVLVDSSKLPPYGFVLTGQRELPVSLLQLTRDPRAVVHSWRQPKGSADLPGEALFAMRPMRAAYDWLSQSSATDLVLSRRVGAGRYRRVAYEAFATSPREVLAGVASWMGQPGAQLPLRGEHVLHLAATHSIQGNPDRHGSSERVIANQERWRGELPAKDRRLVSLVTAPLRWRYGYR